MGWIVVASVRKSNITELELFEFREFDYRTRSNWIIINNNNNNNNNNYYYDDDDDDDYEDDDDNIYFYSAIFIAVLWRFPTTINFLKNKLTIMHCLNIFKKLCVKNNNIVKMNKIE